MRAANAAILRNPQDVIPSSSETSLMRTDLPPCSAGRTPIVPWSSIDNRDLPARVSSPAARPPGAARAPAGSVAGVKRAAVLEDGLAAGAMAALLSGAP